MTGNKKLPVAPAQGAIAGMSRIKPLKNRRSSTISLLDVGSSKITCMIARLKPRENSTLRRRTHSIEVAGFGCTRSRGIKSGFVVDVEEAERAIRLAVDAAERQADLTIGSVIVNVSCGRLSADAFTASQSIAGECVTKSDVRKLLAAGSATAVEDGRLVMHSLPISYGLDDQIGIADPEGMIGSDLKIDLIAVTGDEAPIRNLELTVNRCHLDVETVVASPYASGLASLVDDELELGVACLDLGGGTTGLSIFENGRFVYADSIPIGGHHVTMDVARGLSARLSDAERLKVRQGSALPSASDEHEMLALPPVAEMEDEDVHTFSRSTLIRIIRPRVEETMELAWEMLKNSGYASHVGKRIVLTGGASQLTGLQESARRVFGPHVRLGRPLGVSGLPKIAKGPAFSTVVGLGIYPQVSTIEQFKANHPVHGRLTGTHGYLARFGQWFKESF